MTPRISSSRRPWLLGVIALLGVSLACRLDMLLKPTNTPRPVLSVTPVQVRDSARAGSSDVRTSKIVIANTGGGKLTWSATDHSPWIHLDPSEGDVPDTLAISLDPNDLGPGEYDADVTIIARDGKDSVAGTIAVTFLVQRPGLSVTPLTITHQTNVNSNATFNETIQISNTGTGALDWTASNSKPWLTLGASTGHGSGSLPITINSSGLSGGTYQDDVVITADGAEGSPAHVTVTLTMFAPGLAVTPSSIKDSATAGSTVPDSATLHVSNSGTGAITWTAVKHQPWVHLSKTSGNAPADVLVTLNPSGLPPGTQRDTIVFSSAEATNGPVSIPVELQIVQPGLVVTPPAISATAQFGDTKHQQFTLSISNSAAGPLAWVAGADQPWIGLSPAGGLAPSTVTVTIDPTGLASGPHSGNITVTAPGAAGSPAVIPVQLTIQQKACSQISITPDVVKTGTLDATDCQAPHRPGSFANYYVFTANPGDTISIRMSASFDAYLILDDGSGNMIASNDDCPGATDGSACILEFPIAVSSHYYIEATSAQPGATGPLTITVLRERPPSAPQQLGQFRQNGTTAIQVGDTIPETSMVIKGKINDPNLTDSVHLDVEVEPLGSPFTDAPTAMSDVVPAGTATMVAVTVSGLNPGTGYHWQARTCDRTDRCSAWLKYGNNAESAPDFFVAPLPPPPPPSSPPLPPSEQ
jgi:hypothetical protein